MDLDPEDLRQLGPDVLLGDPFSARVLSLPLLSRKRQLEWVAKAQASLIKCRDELEAVPDAAGADPAARAKHELIGIRLDWLGRLEAQILRLLP